MKRLLSYTGILILFLSCQNLDTPPDRVEGQAETPNPELSSAELVYIEVNKTGGFNIYSKSGELILEYTKQNTDSVSLEILNDIFLSGQYYNH